MRNKPIYKQEQQDILAKLNEALDYLHLESCHFGGIPRSDNCLPKTWDEVDDFIKKEIRLWVETWPKSVIEGIILTHFEREMMP